MPTPVPDRVDHPPPIDAIVELLTALVRTASRAGEDDLAPVAGVMQRWFSARGLPVHLLAGEHGQPLGLYAEVRGAQPGPWVLLDATLDTAGFGDVERWTDPPTSACVRDGWLHGRGSGDSKAAAALFAHLLAAWAARGEQHLAGRLGVLFDLDEHSGGFGGARAFFDHPLGDEPPPRPDVVVIGYPGDHEIVTGGRGFLRARLQVAGVAAHSGAATTRGVNAIDRAVELARALNQLDLPGPDAQLGLSPQLTITGIDGGGPGFSVVPDRCELRLDLRLTPSFDAAAARAAVQACVQTLDGAAPARPGSPPPTRVEWIDGWPAYRVPDTHPMVRALQAATAREFGAPRPTAVVGPSNIGNHLAGLGVPTLAGYGPHAEGVHATDERVHLASLAPVWRVYDDALRQLLGAGAAAP